MNSSLLGISLLSQKSALGKQLKLRYEKPVISKVLYTILLVKSFQKRSPIIKCRSLSRFALNTLGMKSSSIYLSRDISHWVKGLKDGPFRVYGFLLAGVALSVTNLDSKS